MIKQQAVNNKFKLDLILKITQAINENSSANELLQKYEQLLFEELKIGKIAVFKYNSGWEKLLISGVSNDLITQINIDSDLKEFTDITFISSDFPEKLWPFDFIIPIPHKNKILAYILIADMDGEMEGISPAIKHLHFIQTISNIIIVAMENQRMHQELLEQEALKKEMEVASRIQNLLIPSQESLPQNQYIKTQGYYQPHQEIGGDYYDFINLNKHEIGFCIGDVSGKGIPAALIMSNFQAILRTLFHTDTPLDKLIQNLNEKVCKSSNGEKFLTFFIGIYNYETGKLKYINASHHPPILYDYLNQKTTFLKTGCIGLGMLDEIPHINVGEIDIASHSKLLCYTDGLVELEKGDQMKLEIKSITEIFASSKNLSDTFSDLSKHIEIGQKENIFIDDISLFGIEFNH